MVRCAQLFRLLPAVLILAAAGAAGEPPETGAGAGSILVQVFYKQQQPSVETYRRVKDFLEEHHRDVTVEYLLMTDPVHRELMDRLGFPTEHFPFGLAVNGMTSARIDNELILFALFPDFMHHIGRHQGNWSLAHLSMVLEDPTLLRPEIIRVRSAAGGKKQQEGN